MHDQFYFDRLLFWTEKSDNEIKCSLADGTGTTTVASGLNRIKGIAVDMTGQIYQVHNVMNILELLQMVVLLMYKNLLL